VVDLRIGAHEDFTRVVFELDTPAGYRIERSSPAKDVWELVVSIDASSIPRKVQSSKSLIGLVRITPQGNRAVAHIELRRDGLSLKEMILASPPRIVLDVLDPARVAASAKKKASQSAAREATPPAPKPAPKAATPPAPKPAPKLAAAPSPAPRAAPAPTPAAKPAPAPKPTAKVEVAKAAPPLAPESAPPAPAASPSDSAQPSAAEKAPWGAARQPAALPATPSATGVPGLAPGLAPDAEPKKIAQSTAQGRTSPAEQARIDRNQRLGQSARPSGAASDAGSPPASPGGVDAQPAEDDSSGMGGMTMGIAALVLVAAGAFLAIRRRKAGSASADADDEYDEAGPSDENPFAELGSADGQQPPLTMAEPSTQSAMDALDPSEAVTSEIDIGGMEVESEISGEQKEDELVQAPLIRESSMELDGAQTMVSGIGQTPGAGEDAESDEEVVRMIREFERRMASLESRLDEVVDARERLERQVAAQTEELRVQRAAIARTQRAVRNMSRPEDEGPTEPALRDPQ
jgi:hypothetical protein